MVGTGEEYRSPNVAMALCGLGNALLAMGRLEESLFVFAHALVLQDRVGANVAPWMFGSISKQFKMQIGRQSVASTFFAKMAVTRIHDIRQRAKMETSTSGSRPEAGRLAGGEFSPFHIDFMLEEKWAHYYQVLASELIDGGRLLEAENVLALLQQQELGNPSTRASTPDPAFNGVEKRWNSDLELLAKDASNGVNVRGLGDLVRSALTFRDRAGVLRPDVANSVTFLRMLRQESLKDRLANGATLPTLPENSTYMQTMLGRLGGGQSRTAIVQLIVASEGVRLLMLTADESVRRQIDVPLTELNRLVTAFRRDLQNPATNVLPSSQRLYDLLLRSIEDELRTKGINRLVVGTTGPLRYVPFAALHDGKNYVVEKFAVSNLIYPGGKAPSRQVSMSDFRIAAFGVSRKVSNELRALPQVKTELESIVKVRGGANGIIPGDLYLDDRFTSGNFKTALLSRPNIVHIATHFKFGIEGVRDSMLLMGDGTLTTFERLVGGGDFFKGINLFVLSACESSLEPLQNSSSGQVAGVAMYALQSGAGMFIGTLWAVYDSSTAILMKDFYAAATIHDFSQFDEALRVAQLHLLRGTAHSTRFAHPYYWAAFSLSRQ